MRRCLSFSTFFRRSSRRLAFRVHTRTITSPTVSRDILTMVTRTSTRTTIKTCLMASSTTSTPAVVSCRAFAVHRHSFIWTSAIKTTKSFFHFPRNDKVKNMQMKLANATRTFPFEVIHIDDVRWWVRISRRRKLDRAPISWLFPPLTLFIFPFEKAHELIQNDNRNYFCKTKKTKRKTNENFILLRLFEVKTQKKLDFDHLETKTENDPKGTSVDYPIWFSSRTNVVIPLIRKLIH